jgi:hypothetical protein
MRLLPHEIAILILEDAFEDGIYPDPRTAFEGKEDALSFLRDLTEEDFGYDTAGWRDWFKRCTREMLDLHWDELLRKHKARRAADGSG